MPTWIGTIITAIIGAVLGSYLAYQFSGPLETKKQRAQIQITAHADFLKAEAAWQRAGAEADNDEKTKAERDASLKIRDAAFRIVVFSPVAVVKALAVFVEQNHKHEACKLTQSDIDLYQILRRQTQIDGDFFEFLRFGKSDPVSKEKDISDQELAMALFGCKLNNARDAQAN